MKVISIRKEKILIVLYALIILAGLVKSFSEESVVASIMPVSKKIILIDAGHGGWDPGKVSESDGILEKDINLQIALKLQKYLEHGGSYVIMTRADDKALSDSKSSDMKDRKQLANFSKADILISIHQNAYPSEDVQGAQVFYFDESNNSKRLADYIQKEVKDFVDVNNKRTTKSNTSYYILKKTTIPSVIVECGFLSSTTERNKLKGEEYQEKIAWAIYKGIINYFSEADKPMA